MVSIETFVHKCFLKSVAKNLPQFTGKNLSRILFLKKRLCTSIFPTNFAKCFITAFVVKLHVECLCGYCFLCQQKINWPKAITRKVE